MRTSLSGTLALVIVVLFALSLTTPSIARTAPAEPPGQSTQDDRADLRRWAADTWQSMTAMVEPDSGIPADQVSEDGVRSDYTSPTNIGTYLWSTVAAKDLRLIRPWEMRDRIEPVLDALEAMERHEPSGQYFNWYDPGSLEVLTTWPDNGDPVLPFLSSVDNGWLAAALRIVADAVPQERDRALALAESMDFGFYYDPQVGQIRGGAWTVDPQQACGPPTADSDGDGTVDVWFTCHHYGALNTEPRIASYLGIAAGQIPAEHYYSTFRTFPDTCDWSWQETKPEGEWRTYDGVTLFQGHYTYAGIEVVPAWGGSMFEALMVPLVVPEEEWGPDSWGINHPNFVAGQIHHGIEEADYGYWGFSPANNPAGGYREYGVDQMGLDPAGYTSDQERTTVDPGFEGCPGREPQPTPTEFGRGVVTPHASFLALDFARDEAIDNLRNLERDFAIYSWGGFLDSVDTTTGTVSRSYLALDQGMVMAALANELTHDRFQRRLSRWMAPRLEPLLAAEDFGITPAGMGS